MPRCDNLLIRVYIRQAVADLRQIVIRLWFRLSKLVDLRQRAVAFVRGAIVVSAFGQSGQRRIGEFKVFIRSSISSVLVSVRQA